MLVVNSVSYSAGVVTASFSVNRADIDVDAATEEYGLQIYRSSDNVQVHNFDTTWLVDTGSGVYTHNITNHYNVAGTYFARVVPTTGGDTVNTSADSGVFTIGGSPMAAPALPVVTPPTAPTAPTKPYVYNLRYLAQNGHGESMKLAATSADNAFAALQARAKITGSSHPSAITSFSETIHYGLSSGPSLGGTGPTADATLILHRAADNSTKTLKLPDMLLSYAISTGSKFIDTSNADVVAVATAFEDEYGNGGYVMQPDSHYDS